MQVGEDRKYVNLVTFIFYKFESKMANVKRKLTHPQLQPFIKINPIFFNITAASKNGERNPTFLKTNFVRTFLG